MRIFLKFPLRFFNLRYKKKKFEKFWKATSFLVHKVINTNIKSNLSKNKRGKGNRANIKFIHSVIYENN